MDVARHFLDVDTVVDVMDLMADLALNVLHLHLSDDQAWRVEIPALPELTALSSQGAVGGVNPTETTGVLTCGYYTTEDLENLSTQAATRGILLVPEVDVPGHTTAALHAMPGLNLDGVCPPMYDGAEVGFSSLRVDAPDTQRFLDEVFAALAPYAPLGVHIGGDECYSTDPDEYATLVEMAAQSVRAQGRRVIGWQESADHLCEGDLAQVWDPLTIIPGASPEHIKGIEAAMWTETVRTREDLGMLMLPRLSAAAEVAWTGKGTGAWESYRRRVAGFARLWRSRGWSFFPDEHVDWC